MTHIARIGIFIAAVAATGSGGSPARTTTGSRAIVVAELFTSEGCSSCPPADSLLRRLVAEQPIDGVEIVGLSNHVDYWDHLGWRDPFSSALFSQRQTLYANTFRSASVYTPQMVVDGSLQSVGSDEASVERNIVKAAKEPKAVLDVSAAPASDTTLRIEVRVQVSDRVRRTGSADVLIAVTEDGLVSRVPRGENIGRTLSHTAVVRLLRTVAHVAAKDQVASHADMVKLEKDWRPEHLRVVALLQEQASRRIIGAGVTRLSVRRPTP